MKLYYQEKGTGQPLVLLHGNGEDSSYFQAQIEYFSADYRVIAVDTRGHGHSPRGTAPFTLKQFVKDLKQLFQELSLSRVILLGFSDGGNIALLFTLRYPSYVERLILNGANLNPFGVKLQVQLPILFEYATACIQKKTSKKELLGLMVKEPWIPAEQLKQISVPTLVIAGTRDMIRDRHTRKIAEALPKGELTLLAGTHFIAAEEPEAFHQAVEHFLKKGNQTEKQMKVLWEKRRVSPIGWEQMRHSAVLVPLIRKDGELCVLFEVRASRLHSQPGEVCFPGGAVESGETKREAALRETQEELLLREDQIELLAPLDVLVTPGNMTVWPFLGVLKEYQNTFSEAEVERVFTVPLSWFLEREPECYTTAVQTVPGEEFPYELIPGGSSYAWKKGRYDVLFYRHEQAVIWGMTAKILASFLELYRASFPSS